MTYSQDYSIHEVSGYINWLYFFHAWGFPARYGSIARVHGCVACRQNWLQSFPSEERSRAAEAMKLLDEAQTLLRQWDECGMRTHFRVRLLRAYGDGEDIFFPDLERRLPLLRQQHDASLGPCLCLSDFVKPLGKGEPDMVGVFSSTTDASMVAGEDADEYSRLLSQTLADRLAEATAEAGHAKVRREWWGYAKDEKLTVDEMLQERYQGKRPAVGYPSMPDQSLCFILSELLDFPSLGISLTENGAMLPHASTCGLMLSHPATQHFSVGKVGDDQLRSYAMRRGMTVEELRRFF